MLRNPRQIGKSATENKYPGRTVYKEVITEGRDRYQIRNSETGKMETFVATLSEIVPVHTPCYKCKKFISNAEAEMADVMIVDQCGMCKKLEIQNKFDGKPFEVKCTHRKQTFVCFECFEEECDDC